MEEKKIVILMGIQASGKSTFYKKFLNKDYVRVNLDTLRSRQKEQELIDECFREGKSFAIDNTNPTKLDRARYIIPAKSADYRVIGYFLQSKIKECVKRNELREGKERVPEKAIAATSNKLEHPSYSEGFDELYFVENDGETMTVKRWVEYK